LHLKQNTDRLQRKQPTLLRPTEKADPKKSKYHKSKAGINGVLPCPLWVKSGHRRTSNQCPLYTQKQTLKLSREMSACQKQTYAPQHVYLRTCD
jgi:hypothetical protein